MATAVIIGPGRVGCGFAGPVLRAGGYEPVYVGRDRAVVDNMNRLGRYRVRLVGDGRRRAVTVDGVRALDCTDMVAVARAIARADLVATAVGAHELARIAPLIAAGLPERTRPLNILCFENLADVGPRLRALVAEHIAPGDQLELYGCAGAVVMRAITRRLGDPCGDRPLTFVGDLPGDFAVERGGLVAALPRLPGMTLTDDYTAAMRAKVCIFSAGHATAAYLGHVNGHRHVHTAMRDPAIRATVLGAMDEGRRGILARYGPTYAGRADTLCQIADRFENAAVQDPVARVGRDPLRKLAGDDRLIGAARLAAAAGVTPVHLCTAAAAALCFNAPGDASARRLRARLRRDGIGRTLAEVTGLGEGDPLIARIVAQRQRMDGARAA
jgi:mannitol-1-phosphate 5-dehydrogenase